jgi:hypothetical protein
MVTPLEQAKAWATYVMFGAGMFAAGRVEEAFRELETEYNAMSASSKGLIFSEPSTTINGINEYNREDRSSFREAVGRYNFLAARVSGALRLTIATSIDFASLLIVVLLSVLGFAGLTSFLRKQKY